MCVREREREREREEECVRDTEDMKTLKNLVFLTNLGIRRRRSILRRKTDDLSNILRINIYFI